MSIFDDIEAAIIGSAVGSVTQGALLIAAVARQKAPVRRIFAGDHRIIRTKSIEESFVRTESRVTGYISSEVATGYSARYPHRLSLRRLATKGLPGSLAPEAEDLLTRAGRYEVRSGRAAHRAAHHETRSGGRLRSEIHATAARLDGREVVAEVISPTRYAGFMEFGTRHNRAHPYLRPARDESLSAIRESVGKSAATAARRSLGRARGKPIKVHLEVSVR